MAKSEGYVLVIIKGRTSKDAVKTNTLWRVSL
jgi:hypothetical protein